MRKMLGILLAGGCIAALSGCTLPFISTPPPTNVGDLTNQPTVQGTAAPTPTQVNTPIGATEQPTLAPELGGGGAGSARPGEVLFVRQGQVWAIGMDGSGERPLTPTPLDSDLRDLSLSPSGKFLAFTVNGLELDLLDLETGAFNIIEAVEFGHIGPINWALDGDELFYHKLTFDTETSRPSTSAIYWIDAAGNLTPTLVVESGLEEGPEVYPGFPFGDSLLVQETFGGQGDLGDWYFYPIAGDGGAIRSFAPGFSLWDVSFDAQRVLMFNREEYQSGGAVPIYIAALNPAEGAVGTVQLSPEDEFMRYQIARFAPDGIAVLALGQFVGDPATDVSPAQLIYLLPSAAGTYTAAPIDLPEGHIPIAFSFVDGDTAVVSGIPAPDPNAPDVALPSQLWLVDLAIGEAILLTQGDLPIVLPTE